MPSKETMDYKRKKVEELDRIFDSNGVFLFDYRGLTVAQMETVRNRVKELGANVRVIKNRLAIKHFEKLGKPYGRDLFKGPIAAAYADKNFIEVAKTMVEIEKELEKVHIRAGFIERMYANADKIKEVSKLPNKEQLLAQLAFSIGMPLRKMGTALNAPLRSMLVVLKNLKDKKEKEEKQ